jgi:hypothetical protein
VLGKAINLGECSLDLSTFLDESKLNVSLKLNKSAFKETELSFNLTIMQPSDIKDVFDSLNSSLSEGAEN